MKCRLYESTAKGKINITKPFLYIVQKPQAEVEEPDDPQLLSWESKKQIDTWLVMAFFRLSGLIQAGDLDL